MLDHHPSVQCLTSVNVGVIPSSWETDRDAWLCSNAPEGLHRQPVPANAEDHPTNGPVAKAPLVLIYNVKASASTATHL